MAKKAKANFRDHLCERIWQRLEMLDHVMTSSDAEKLTLSELLHISVGLDTLLDAASSYFARVKADNAVKRVAAKKTPAVKKGRKRG